MDVSVRVKADDIFPWLTTILSVQKHVTTWFDALEGANGEPKVQDLFNVGYRLSSIELDCNSILRKALWLLAFSCWPIGIFQLLVRWDGKELAVKVEEVIFEAKLQVDDVGREATTGTHADAQTKIFIRTFCSYLSPL